MDKKYTYFISSTYKDLIVERRAIANYVLKVDHIPIGMEQFGAIDTSQWEYITRLIDTSDYFILLVAGRYGAIDPSDPDGLSYTHKEFRYARQNNIPIIGVLHKNPANISSEFSERDPKAAKKLAAFRKEVGEARLLAFYDDTAELMAEVAASIAKGMTLFQRPGWTRQDSSAETSDMLNTQIKLLHRELAARDSEIIHLKNLNAGLTARFVEESQGLDKARIRGEALDELSVKVSFKASYTQHQVRKEIMVESNYMQMYDELGLLIVGGKIWQRTEATAEDELFWRMFEKNKLIRTTISSIEYSTASIKQFISEIVRLKYVIRTGNGFVLTDKGKLVHDSLQ